MTGPGDGGGDGVSGIRELRSSLDRVVAGLGERGVMLDVHNQWPDVVGEAIAGHCTPRRLVDGRLQVEVDHPGWASEIRYLTPQILERLGAALGAGVVTSIGVSVAGRAR